MAQPQQVRHRDHSAHLEQAGRLALNQLHRGPAGEVARPPDGGRAVVGHEVVELLGQLQLLALAFRFAGRPWSHPLVDGKLVAAGRRIEDVNLGRPLSDIPDELVERFEVLVGGAELEVATKRNQQMVGHLSLGVGPDEVDHVLALRFDIVLEGALVVHNGIVLAEGVETEAVGRVVAVPEDVCEDTSGLTGQGAVGVPDEVETLVESPLALVLVVDASEEHPVETELGEQRGLFAGVAEGVDLPADLGTAAGAEGLVEELEAQSHLLYGRVIGHRRLVVHAPAAIDELEPALVDEPPDDGLHLVALLEPPLLEEGHLDVDESLLPIHQQLRNHRVEDVLDAGVTEALLRPVKVLVHRLEPADIVMGVGNDMDV